MSRGRAAAARSVGRRLGVSVAIALVAVGPPPARADMCDEHAPARVLVVEDVAGGRILHQEPVVPGDVVALSWVHSSENVPVRGVLVVAPDVGLQVKETAFAGPGPGLPAPGPGDAWRYRDGMIVTEGGGAVGDVRLRVSRVARQRLTLPSGREVDLSATVPEGAAVRIAVR